MHQQDLQDNYPQIKALGIRGSENPNLLPKGAITVRIHSVGGWGAITTGKNLAMTLFELLGWDIKANPKYGSEKKGQPTTYYLSAAPEPIRINCEYTYVDVVLSPDPNVFGHSNPLAGLKKGGVLHHPVEPRRRNAGPISRSGRRSSSSTTTFTSSTSTPSRSRAKKPVRPNCNCACRASPSRAPSSPPARR